MLLLTSVVYAGNYTFQPRSYEWEWKTKKRDEKTNVVGAGRIKFVTYTEYKVGRKYNSPVYRLTNKYIVKKGETLTYSHGTSRSINQTFNITAGAKLRSFGLSFGYSNDETITTNEEITHSTGTADKDGTYWYGVSVSLVDVSMHTKKSRYNLKKNKWVFDRIESTETKTGTQFQFIFPFRFRWVHD